MTTVEMWALIYRIVETELSTVPNLKKSLKSLILRIFFFFQWRRVTGEGQFMTHVKVILIKRELPTLWYRLGQNFVSAPKLHNYFESHWSLVSSLTYALMNFIQLLSGGSFFLVLINVIGHDLNYSTLWDKYLVRPNFFLEKKLGCNVWIKIIFGSVFQLNPTTY